MKIRAKSIIISFSLLVLLMGMLCMAATAVLLSRFEEIEKDMARKNIARAESAIRERISALDTKLVDWAAWDDSYKFVSDRNAAYEKSNLIPDSLANLKINFIVFINRAGDQVYAFNVDLYEKGKPLPLPPSVSELVRRLPENSKGIAVVEGKPVMVAARPILHSDGTGPSAGKLVFGRWIDPAELRDIMRVVGFPFALVSNRGPRAQTVVSAVPEEARLLVTATRINGSKAVRGVIGDVPLQIEYAFYRKISIQGWHCMVSLGMLMLFISFVCVLILYLLMEKFILARVIKLNSMIVGLSRSRDLNHTVCLEGDDEIHDLSVEIDSLIRNLARSEHDLKESEQRYRVIFENTGTALVLTDTKGRNVRLVNSEFERLTGYSKADVARGDWHVTQGIHHDDLHRVREYNEYMLHKPAFITNCYEFRIIRKDGKVVTVMAVVSPISSDSLIWSLLDITSRKLVEDSLTNSERRLLDIVNSLPEAAFAVDLEGRIIIWNKAVEEMTGVPAASMFGKDSYEHSMPFYHERRPMLLDVILHPELESVVPVFSYLKREHDVVIAETNSSAANGKLVCYWCKVSRLYDSKGKVIGAIEFIRDITERKKTETLLRLQTRELEMRASEMEDSRLALLNMMEDIKEEQVRAENLAKLAESASRTKSDFLANMSHEIRTPINAIMGFADLVDQTPLTATQRDYVKTIRQSSGILLSLVNDILDISKVEAGQMKLEAIEFDLELLVEDIMRIIRSRLGNKNVMVYYEIDPGMSTGYIGDPTRLMQVLFNLLANAIKFTSEGEVCLRVGRDGARDTGEGMVQVRFSVKDTGIGISKDKQGQIFDAFMQADSSITRKFGGTGLGLAISKKLVEVMGGRISVQSEEGQGSEFIVILPLKESGKGAACNEADARFIADTRLVLVSRREIALRVIGDICRRSGFKVFCAAADMLHDCIPPFSPHGVIVDLRGLHGVEGAALLAAVRERFPGTKVLAVNPESSLSGGFDGAMVVPLTRTDLVREVKQALFAGQGEQLPLQAGKKAEGVLIEGIDVLVAEDNPVNQKLLSIILGKMGGNVHLVNNGQEAVDALNEKPYQLCLLDIQMPVLDGIEAAKLIRKGLNKDIPIIAITAGNVNDYAAKMAASGINDYLMKPFDAVKLKEKVACWVTRHAAGI